MTGWWSLRDCWPRSNDPTANHLNPAIRQDVIDAHGRALVAIDQIRWDRISATRRWNCIVEPQFAQSVEDLPATIDETFDGDVCTRREFAKRLHQLTTIDGILGANAIEIAETSTGLLKRRPVAKSSASVWVGAVGAVDEATVTGPSGGLERR